jgi:hypothetical protein
MSGALFALGMQLSWNVSTGILLAFGLAAAVIVVAFIPAPRARATNSSRCRQNLISYRRALAR